MSVYISLLETVDSDNNVCSFAGRIVDTCVSQELTANPDVA